MSLEQESRYNTNKSIQATVTKQSKRSTYQTNKQVNNKPTIKKLNKTNTKLGSANNQTNVKTHYIVANITNTNSTKIKCNKHHKTSKLRKQNPNKQPQIKTKQQT